MPVNFCPLPQSFLTAGATIRQVGNKRTVLDFLYQNQNKIILICQEVKLLMQVVIKQCLLFGGTGAQNKGSYKITITEIEKMKRKEEFVLGRRHRKY